MKTRTGFVSNSSSSSFIVVFENDPTDVDNLAAEMGECYSNYEPWDESVEVPCNERVVERVHADIKDLMPATIPELMDEFESDMYWEIDKLVDSDDYRDPHTCNLDWQAYSAAKNEIAGPMLATKVENFKKRHKGKHIYILEYADDGGEAMFEHGEIFRNIPHVKVSHH